MKKLIHGIDITRMLHSRYWVIATFIAIVVVALKSAGDHVHAFDITCQGIFDLTTIDRWTSGENAALTLGLLTTAGIGAILYLINTSFNILRSISLIYLTVFFTIIGTIPALTAQFFGGQTLALFTFGALYPLFSAYQSPGRTREVFLAFFMLTTALSVCGSTTAWIVLLIVFTAGIGQMRLLNPRTLIAASIGVITPLWLLWGFGVIDHVSLSAPSLFSLKSTPAWVCTRLSIYLTLIVLTWLTLSIFNLVRIYNYNARLRAYNGLFSLLGIAILIAIVIDPLHIAAYLPLFIGCTAMQAGHFFTIIHGSRSWIGILCVCLPFWFLLLCANYL